MVNFDQLITQQSQPTVVEPRQLFQTLQRNRNFEYLRDVQGDVLGEWHKRRNEQDLVIKMNTGSGKTLVGLLLLWSKLKEGKGPALYLCPNIHLASQVRSEADALGIGHVDFENDNRIPPEFSDSTSILITTVHKLFNGLSVFRVADRQNPVKVGSILVDDAHSCINIARQQFSTSISRKSEIGQQIWGFFASALRQQSLGVYADISQGRGNGCLLVPYWSWEQRVGDVAELLSTHGDSEELRFKWPFLKNGEVLANSSAVISGDKIEIAPRLLPIELVPSFDNAAHRVYMSATLVDDASLIKHFGANPESVRKPIHPKVLGDIGERLIVIPALVDSRIEETTTIDLVEEIKSRHGVNVVILTPSFRGADRWRSKDALVVRNTEIIGTIEKLTSSDSNLVAFANRYDGIDLPNEACRVLVLDDLPSEHVLANIVEASARQDSPILRRQLAQSIEQGMGRGVRSRSDYCIVILAGKKLVAFMTDVGNQSFFSDETRRQVEMGKEVTRHLKGNIFSDEVSNSYQAILNLAEQCLLRDQEWLKYYAQRLQNIATAQSSETSNLALATIELRAWRHASRGRYDLAAKEIGQIFERGIAISNDDKGWYLQMQAQYLHQVDREIALEKQLKAHEYNRKVLRPPSGITYRKLQKKQTNQAYGVLDWISQSNDPNALVSRSDLVLEDLAFGINYESFEQAFYELGIMVGFDPQRPEKENGVGPDILWCMENDQYLIVEAKNEVELSRKEIYKSEAEQLDHSVIWFKQNYTEDSYTPIMIHPSAKLAQDANLEEGTRIVQYTDMQRIVESVRAFVAALATKPSNQWSVQEIANLLQTYELRSNDFLNVRLTRRARRVNS